MPARAHIHICIRDPSERNYYIPEYTTTCTNAETQIRLETHMCVFMQLDKRECLCTCAWHFRLRYACISTQMVVRVRDTRVCMCDQVHH